MKFVNVTFHLAKGYLILNGMHERDVTGHDPGLTVYNEMRAASGLSSTEWLACGNTGITLDKVNLKGEIWFAWERETQRLHLAEGNLFTITKIPGSYMAALILGIPHLIAITSTGVWSMPDREMEGYLGLTHIVGIYRTAEEAHEQAIKKIVSLR
jgi:hypothetical protein